MPKQQLIQFLLQIHCDDHIGIYSMGPCGVHVLYDYSRDPAILLAKSKSLSSEKERGGAKDSQSAGQGGTGEGGPAIVCV